MRALTPHRWVEMAVAVVVILTVAGCASFNQQQDAPPNPMAAQTQPSAPEQPTSPASPPDVSPPRPLFYDFQDIPIPYELSLQSDDSYVFQSGALKLGILTLRGRVDLNSLINFFQIAMPRESWKPKGGFRYKRSVLIFEKPDKTCIINLYEKLFYSYVEIYVAPSNGQV